MCPYLWCLLSCMLKHMHAPLDLSPTLMLHMHAPLALAITPMLHMLHSHVSFTCCKFPTYLIYKYCSNSQHSTFVTLNICNTQYLQHLTSTTLNLYNTQSLFQGQFLYNILSLLTTGDEHRGTLNNIATFVCYYLFLFLFLFRNKMSLLFITYFLLMFY